MNNHVFRSLGGFATARDFLPLLRLVTFSLMAITPFSMAQAASVPIDTLSVSSASFNIQITGDGTYNFSGPVVPPVDVLMGTYQDPIVGGTDWKIYSTGLFGNPVPTGTVDGALGTINVDFSSLRGQATLPGYGLIDFALWPLINPPSPTSSYDGATGVFSLIWSEAFSVTLAGLPSPISGTATVTLAGSVTAVPLPVAGWLLGSGLLGLASVARRKKA